MKYQFSGKRVKRGFYQLKEGFRVNEDVAVAWNIGRKNKHEGFIQVCRGLLTSPVKISNLNVSWG